MAERWQQWMPFHIDRWKGSAHVQAMCAAARAGYLYLLAEMWQSGDCTVPDDDMELQVLSGLTSEEWAAHGPRIRRRFTAADGLLTNDVLRGEWAEAKRIFEARQASARRTTSVRSPSRSPNEDRNAEPTHKQEQEHIQKQNNTEQKSKEPDVFDSNMVARAVMHDCRLSGMKIQMALEQIARFEIIDGGNGIELVPRLADAWHDYERCKPQLSYAVGAEKFFGEGWWKNKPGWPWKQQQQNQQRGNKFDELRRRIDEEAEEADRDDGGTSGRSAAFG